MQRGTRIVATLGPATDRPGVLEQLLDKGLDVARINFSHGTGENMWAAYGDFASWPGDEAASWPCWPTFGGPSCVCCCRRRELSDGAIGSGWGESLAPD